MSDSKIVTRFAPSPTGYFHAGSYRTALFAWLYARKNGGKFILRIEDTDRERSRKEFEDNIVESLEWMGLDYDERYRQSDRVGAHKDYIEKLIKSGFAYVSKETPETAGKGGREEVIRFRNPDKKVAFDDIIRGRIEFDTTELGDFVIAKSADEPVFHLAVAADDIDSGVTHVIRGEDHISNTPRQILVYEALGARPPIYAHIPLLMAKDRSKLSKRNGAVAVTEYRRAGYLPEALVNYMALLGWHPDDDREIMSLEEIMSAFSLDRVQKSGAVFDDDKLKWFNRQYMRKLDDGAFAAAAAQFLPEWLAAKDPLWKRLEPAVRDKICAFGELRNLLGPDGELGFAGGPRNYQAEKLNWKKAPDRTETARRLGKAAEIMAGLPDDGFTAESLKAAIWPLAEKEGRGEILWPLRMALTGQEKSPDPFACAAILGRTESLKRLETAVAKLV